MSLSVSFPRIVVNLKQETIDLDDNNSRDIVEVDDDSLVFFQKLIFNSKDDAPDSFQDYEDHIWDYVPSAWLGYQTQILAFLLNQDKTDSNEDRQKLVADEVGLLIFSHCGK